MADQQQEDQNQGANKFETGEFLNDFVNFGISDDSIWGGYDGTNTQNDERLTPSNPENKYDASYNFTRNPTYAPPNDQNSYNYGFDEDVNNAQAEFSTESWKNVQPSPPQVTNQFNEFISSEPVAPFQPFCESPGPKFRHGSVEVGPMASIPQSKFRFVC